MSTVKVYPTALADFAKKLLNWPTDTIKCQALSAAYVYSDSHLTLADVAAGSLGSPVTLASKTTTNGVASCASPLTIASLGPGADVTAALIYKDTGTPSTSRLIAYLGVPPTVTNGNNFNFVVPVGGLFKLAQAFYLPAAESFLKAEIDWTADDVRLQLFDSGYTYSSAHQFLSSVGSGARVGSPVALTARTAINGVLSCAAAVVTAPPSARTVTGGVVYVHTGVDATARLIMAYRVGYGLNLDTNGADVTFTPDASVRKMGTV